MKDAILDIPWKLTLGFVGLLAVNAATLAAVAFCIGNLR